MLGLLLSLPEAHPAHLPFPSGPPEKDCLGPVAILASAAGAPSVSAVSGRKRHSAGPLFSSDPLPAISCHSWASVPFTLLPPSPPQLQAWTAPGEAPPLPSSKHGLLPGEAPARPLPAPSTDSSRRSPSPASPAPSTDCSGEAPALRLPPSTDCSSSCSCSCPSSLHSAPAEESPCLQVWIFLFCPHRAPHCPNPSAPLCHSLWITVSKARSSSASGTSAKPAPQQQLTWRSPP
ncbi:POM121-like protein 1-like [Plecturocebus cupreus]